MRNAAGLREGGESHRRLAAGCDAATRDRSSRWGFPPATERWCQEDASRSPHAAGAEADEARPLIARTNAGLARRVDDIAFGAASSRVCGRAWCAVSPIPIDVALFRTECEKSRTTTCRSVVKKTEFGDRRSSALDGE
jgi:hypothetical protein